MAVTICPWCQSEVIHEEGQEPDKFCPICDNELDGYRTLRIDMGNSEDEFEDDDELLVEEDSSWDEPEELREMNPELVQFEETVVRLLDEQELVPECPQCREYMVEAGEQVVTAEQFHARKPSAIGKAILEAPFNLTVYMCPACFTVQTLLSEEDRARVVQRLSK
ncbi:MAG: hypothetical protein P0Y55_03825 [Candidatus Cohnella colombiensis]|uniref:Uncharacterized protein n=1 Tax=Candidatus Cohnella colombiensis TaxID=3121368 RepID=A0AA95F5G6_9BACL|nr:MAG: hypothetical protein P0Y55_03825 [Cohnella sp.]